MTREVVFDALCRVVGDGEIAYAADVASALRDAGHEDAYDGAVAELLDSLVDAGEVTVVPVDRSDGSPSRLAYGIPLNSL